MNMITYTFKKFFSIAVLSCLATVFASGQDIDKRLWGTWQLDSVGMTVNRVEQKYKLSTLLADRKLTPRNMFTALYFFGNQVGVNSTESFFATPLPSLKGTFTTNNGLLTVTLRDSQPRTFTYSVEDKRLKIWYTLENIQFYLLYRLTHETVGQ